MKSRAVWAALAMVAVALAGCAGDDGPGTGDDAISGKVDEEDRQLAAGKGAVSGLLVDDRFRPIHLTEDPVTEFQAQGFVLLQETGAEVQTSENGEFTFLDLDPGTYTLRVQVAGHEATPQPVQVEEGVFNEISVIARRISSSGSVILTEEYSGFTPCAAAWPIPHGLPNAVLFNCNDSSAQSYRPGPTVNYTGIEGITYMIVEAQSANPGNYVLEVRINNGNPSGGTEYAEAGTEGGDYVKTIIQAGAIYDPEVNENPWNNTDQLEMPLFYRGTQELPAGPGLPVPVLDGSTCTPESTPVIAERCPDLTQDWQNTIGAELANRSTFIISLFIGEPEVDLEAYQLLTSAST